MKSIFPTVLSLSVVLLFTQTAFAEVDCPSAITLEKPRFLSSAQYPEFEQIRTHFNQQFHPPGLPHINTWNENDLQAAHALITALKHNTHQDQVRLSSMINGEICEGTLENFRFEVDASGLRFYLNESNFVTIPHQSHASVDLWLSLPSNCSGCSQATELLEFQNVNFR